MDELTLLIQTLANRLEAVEKTVKTITDSLIQADDEYKLEERHNAFNEKYGSMAEPYNADYQTLFPEQNLLDDLFEALKDKDPESYDEMVEQAINEIKARLDALRAPKEEVAVEEEVPTEEVPKEEVPEEEAPSVEQLDEIYNS